MLFGKIREKASRLKPLQQQGGNAPSTNEASVANSLLFVGAPSGAMLFGKMRKKHRG